MMKILGQYHGYVVQQLNKSLSKSLMKTMSEVQMIVEKIRLPMIVSVLIMGGNGLVPINHMLGLYKGIIIDGESDTAQVFNENNFNKACCDNVQFDGIMNGYVLFPPKKTVLIKDLPPAHCNFSSAIYKLIDENGNSMDLLTSHDKMKKKKNRRKRSWDVSGKRKKIDTNLGEWIVFLSPIKMFKMNGLKYNQ